MGAPTRKRDRHGLARIMTVSAREAVGGSEPTHFTPWIAENIDVLGDAIGLPLAFGDERLSVAERVRADTEVDVGGYRLDVLGRTLDGRRVAIENQYGPSDHSHLGQVITYASGVEADVVIWVAERFQEPHLEAIRWLNRRTDSDCGVFAVRAEFVRIGDSEVAPNLVAEERPSDWARRSRKNAAAGEAWTQETFLESLSNTGDREIAQDLFDRTIRGGGAFWFGRKPGGYIILHVNQDDRYGPYGISIRSDGALMVSGLWRTWDTTKQHPAYGPVAEALGLPSDGPQTGIPASELSIDALWEAAEAFAQMRGAEE